MSLDALTWARAQRVGNPHRKAVLMNLADHHNGETGLCNPSQATIQTETEVSERAVRRHLAELAASGFVSRERLGRHDEYTFPASSGLKTPAPRAGIQRPDTGTTCRYIPAPVAGTPAPVAGTPAPVAGTPAPRAAQPEEPELTGREADARAPGISRPTIAKTRSRPATESQLDFIATLADRTGADVPEMLSFDEASELIDRLKLEAGKPKPGWQHLPGCNPPGDDPKRQWRRTPWAEMAFWERDILQNEHRDARRRQRGSTA